MRYGVKCQDGCEYQRDPGILLRASGEMSCSCGQLYRKHPHCANSPNPDGPGYYLRVLCDGTHVKL